MTKSNWLNVECDTTDSTRKCKCNKKLKMKDFSFCVYKKKKSKMDNSTSSGLMEEYELMKQQKYRVYMTNIDKALKNFEYSSEWADLISALGKLNKVISSYSQYQIIPRRIKISKRLAQCMHPALPSGVHLKALETYDVIFSNTGVERLASELFIYSAGLFPLLGYAAMNVRPTLLGIYEKYFVPLGERLRPALSGFLSGVLPGLEAGLDHFERTNTLLGQVCTAVSPVCFYTCLWECVATNASIRLPAISYVLDHFNKRQGMTEQTYLMGKNTELMMSGLCACLNDAVILVQRNTLEFLLLGFPMHTEIVRNSDLIKLVTNALNTILRRDMSLNRRLYSWLLGSEVISAKRKQQAQDSDSKFGPFTSTADYFESYSKVILIKALRCTLKYSLQSNPVDLRPYKILISLLDKTEIGLAVLDDILCDVVRTMALSNNNLDVTKSANLLFATFDPAYIWDFMTQLYERGCVAAKTNSRQEETLQQQQQYKNDVTLAKFTPEVDSGQASLIEVCYLTEFLLETISLEMYNETTRVYLPRVFLAITQMLTIYSEYLTDFDITAALKLCLKIVSRVQPMITSPAKVVEPPITVTKSTPISSSPHDIVSTGLEKSKSDSKLNQTLLNEDEPIKRSNSNHSMGKKSPKKTKKSKSYSKLDVVEKDVCSDTGQLIISSTAVSTPNLDVDNTDNNKTKSSNKSTISAKKSPSPSRSAILGSKFNKSKGKAEETVTPVITTPSTNGPVTVVLSTVTSPASKQETTMQEYSILEKCIKQYEIFYQIYVARKVLLIEDAEQRRSTVSFVEPEGCQMPISPFYKEFVIEDTNTERLVELNNIFETLVIDVRCRMTRLQSLLHRSIMVQSSSLNDLREIETTSNGPTMLPNSSSLEFHQSSHSKNSNQSGCDNSYLSLNINYDEERPLAGGKGKASERVEKMVDRLMAKQLGEALRHSIKLASNILVELSTFPNYNQTLEIGHIDSDIPPWLKVLSLVACYTKADKETQVTVISTLFEMISLLKSQVEHASNPGVTQAVMLPLLKFEHINYIEQRTRVFQILTSSLWEYLDSRTLDLTQIASLLYQLHNCLDSGLVESVIGNRITNAHLIWSNHSTDDTQRIEFCQSSRINFQSLDSGICTTLASTGTESRLMDYRLERLGNIKVMCTPPRQSMKDCNDTLSESEWNGFKKFELLWHLGRDIQSQQRGFDKTLFKMFDVLELPHYISLRTFAIKWLKESLIRGDLGRLIKPLLTIMLSSNTKRLSVVHVHMLRKTDSENMSFETEKLEDEQKIVIEKDIYAVSSEDGTIRYHHDVTTKQKRSPSRPLRFFGVTLGTKNSSSKTLNYITDKSMPPPPSPTTTSLVSNTTTSTAEANFSLIVNPLDNSFEVEMAQDQDEYASLSSSAPSQMLTDFNNSPLMDTKNATCSFYTSSDEETESDSTRESDDDEMNERNCSEKENSGGNNHSAVRRAPSISTVKKFAGDCEQVADKLTQHDKTKNRKIYPLQKGSNPNEKQYDSMLNEIHDGIIEESGHDLDESTTTAEDFFDNPQPDDDTIVENVLFDLMEQAADSVSTEESKVINDDTMSRHTEQSNLELDNCNFKPSDIHKRLSNTSKTSSESNCSEGVRVRNSSSVEPASCNESFSESEASEKVRHLPKTDQLSSTRPKHKSLSSTAPKKSAEKRSKELKKKKAHLKPLAVNSKLGYDQMTEKFEQSKLNSEILRQNEQEKFANRQAEKNHPSHSHMLLYFGCYDTKQVLYAFQTLRNIMSTDCRMFLCLSITTGVPNGQIKQLLVRHRKSIFGKGFDGSISNTEFYKVYSGCMYLEVLVTLCLYYARSYFQAEEVELNQLPNADDIYGNCKIQSSAIELLTLIFNELIGIVREMGRGLAKYIADLMAKCKVQKIVLHCVMTSVYSFTARNAPTYTEKLLQFNDPGDGKLHAETIQLQLLRLLFAVIKLEFEVLAQKSEDGPSKESSGTASGTSHSPTRVAPATSVRYLPNSAISQQPLFLNAILSALQADNLRHLHRNWTDLVTSCLNCFTFGSLTNIVISVIHQICANIDKHVKLKTLQKSYTTPPDYLVAQLEALTMLCHYCLLDNSQQLSLAQIFNPNANYGGGASSSSTTTNSAQLLNNLMHVFLPTSSGQTSIGSGSDGNTTTTLKPAAPHIAPARNAVLSHLPRIVASVAALWQTEMGQARLVKQQLMELLNPVSLHHGVNFLTSIAVAWQERGEAHRKAQEASVEKSASTIFCSSLLSGVRKDSSTPSIIQSTASKTSNALPQACLEQMLLVKLVSNIRVMPIDSFIQTLHQVVKTPPHIHHSPASLTLEVSALELFYFYMKQFGAAQLTDAWPALLSLLRDGLALSPPAQFVLLATLNEFVQHCIPFQDKKDLRDLHDITSKLVESLSIIAGACLEQTTWLRRNLAVKEESTTSDGRSSRESMAVSGNQQYCVQAQSVLAAVLANLLDIAYGSQEKDKVVTIVTTLMYNIVPYLKNHSARNIPSFYACSHLLANLSTYQYTRKAWRKDVFDLLLDSTFLQIDVSCLPFWKSILDNLMGFDQTTFRDLMNRVSLTQTGSLNIFTSKEQEYEQRALLLKRLAFVIFCSELDQYHKYMPEIQEQLANSLRLPQVVPSIQAAVFLCFRVLLLRMSPDHVTSLWPIIIAEMVQVFLAIEQELITDTEEFSQHIRMLAGLDASWVTNSSNGLHSHGHPHWRMVQLETAKLLELGCVLPATNLPHFQMYRWAFVGSQHDYGCADYINGDCHLGAHDPNHAFIPHVTRIARLMDLRYTTHSPKTQSQRGQHLVLTCQTIANLQDLYGFFSTLFVRWPTQHFAGDAEKDTKNCLAEIEQVLASDFLEFPVQSVVR